MAKAARKKRIRKHVIADMSFHHVAYYVAKAGFTIEGFHSDYGYDANVVTFSASGLVENGLLYIQLKSTDRLVVNPKTKSIDFRISKRDVNLWADEPFPVYLVVFDATGERAYWLYLQRYLEARGITAANMKYESVVVQIDQSQVVNDAAVAQWRADKAAVLVKIGKVKHA